MGLRQILRCAWFTPSIKGVWGLPLLFEGKPGVAKTAIIEEEAQRMGLHVETILGSTRLPEDVGGIPVPIDGRIVRLPDAWVHRAMTAKHSVVFMDEFNLSGSAILKAFLRVINERRIGDHTFPATVRMLAAQNSVEDGGGGDLTAAMANRFGHLPWEGPHCDEWCDWLLSLNGSPEATMEPLNAAAEEARVMDAWSAPWARARGAVTGFLRRRSNLLHSQPNTADPNASKAWASRRTWELTCRAMTGAEIHGLSKEDTDTLIEAFIGKGVAGEFEQWRATADLPDPVEVLDKKVVFKHNPSRLDRTEAVFSSCAAFLTPANTEKRKDRANNLWELIASEAKECWDVAVPCAQVLSRAGLGGFDIPAAKHVIAKMHPLLIASGYHSAST